MGSERRYAAGGLALVLVSSAGYGSQPILARLAYQAGAGVATVLTVRFLLATVILWCILVLRGRGRAALEVLREPRRLLSLLALGGIFSGNAAAFYAAITLLHVTVAELLFYLYPAIVVLLSMIFLRERLGPARLGAVLLAVGGSALTVGMPSAIALPGVGGARLALGLALAVGSAVIYAIYIVLGNRVAASTPLDIAAAVTVTGTTLVFGTAALLGDGASLRVSVPAGAAIVAIALFSTVIATTVFLAGLRRLGPSRAAIAATVEPVVTLLLATIVLGEPPLWFQVAGGVLILAGVVLAQRRPITLTLSQTGDPPSVNLS